MTPREQIESVRRTLHESVVGMKRLDTYAVATQVVQLCDAVLVLAEQIRGHDHLTLDGGAQMPASLGASVEWPKPQPRPSDAVAELLWARFLVEHSAGGRSDIMKAIDEHIALMRTQPPTQEIQRMKIDAEIGQQVRHNHTGITGRVVGVHRDRNNIDWLYVESVDANRLSFERCVPASECSVNTEGVGPMETKQA
jgi:hypothetical protein